MPHLINNRDGSDLEERMDTSLPGASRGAGDMSVRRYRQDARTKFIHPSPTGMAWAAASTEGLLIMAFRLNVPHPTCLPGGDTRLQLVPRLLYVPMLLRFVGEHLDKSPHLEFELLWVKNLLMAHG